MTRAFTASLAVLGLAAMIAFDLVVAPLNPDPAPSGGFCAAVPD